MKPGVALRVAVLLGVLATACTGAESTERAEVDPSTSIASPTSTTAPTATTTSPTSTVPATTTTVAPTFDVAGTVVTPNGAPLPNITVTVGSSSVETDEAGRFAFTGVAPGIVTVTRPGWLPAAFEFVRSEVSVALVLEPRVVRGLRVSEGTAADPERFARLLELAEQSTVNTFVFDTKTESGSVLYETAVAEAHAVGAVEAVYDPAELVAVAERAGLYTVTRIVTFEDRPTANARPAVKLWGAWVDPANPASWTYPLDLAVEACGIGFDEIQFDYVRFPTSAGARSRVPATAGERAAIIASFLSEARARLHPLGCAVSADIFGIVLSADNDQGIGQRPEELAGILDAVSPMLYPSHYSNGWLGFAEPNDHPGPVVADALDDGAPRFGELTAMRPWLQAFYYNGSQVLAQIEEAEARGFGWILWNASGNYEPEWLPGAAAGTE
jgi:hypothetical protein